MSKANYLDYLRSNKFRTLPIFTYPFASSLGINPYDLTVNALKHAQVVKYIDGISDFGFAVGLMDLSLEAEGFGVSLGNDGMNLPAIGPGIIKTVADAHKLTIPNVDHYRTKMYIDAMRNIKTVVHDKPLLATVISPFSLAGILLGSYETVEHIKDNHEIIYTTLEKATTYLREYYRRLLEAGVDGFLICDSMTGILNHSNFDQFSTIFINRLTDEFDEEIYVVYHNCGDVSDTIENIKNIHADIFHFGDCNDLDSILKTFPKNKLVMGNISPIKVFNKKSRKGVERATHSLLKKHATCNNFLISPGCDLPSTIPYGKVVAYLKAVDKFYNK
ncbi:MAG: hypothetical protein JEZ05_03975 [Tenericutes bacterium]|nr:hypothetical protein [Mycoplasmatota bacterium]